MLRTKNYTPLFNTHNFEEILSQNPVDNSFHIRILETILLPCRPITIISEKNGICKLFTEDYYPKKHFYTKSEFIEKGKSKPKMPLPSIDELLKILWQFPKLPYLLGGTIPMPINMGLSHFNPFHYRHTRLFGIDCSGLLYWVTNGNTPRNTSGLIKFGKQVSELKPLDMILPPKHVLIYLGDGYVIESREGNGVVISKWDERKKKLNEGYQFNRFHPQAF